MSEQKHSVQTCSNVYDLGEFKPNDISLVSENLRWCALIKKPNKQKSVNKDVGHSGAHFYLRSIRKLIKATSSFKQYTKSIAKVLKYEKMRKDVCIYMNKRKSSLLLPMRRVFTF